MGNRLPHGVGGRSHWRECYGEAGRRSIWAAIRFWCYTVPILLGPWAYFPSVNRWAMIASGHRGTVRLREQSNQSSSCSECD